MQHRSWTGRSRQCVQRSSQSRHHMQCSPARVGPVCSTAPAPASLGSMLYTLIYITLHMTLILAPLGSMLHTAQVPDQLDQSPDPVSWEQTVYGSLIGARPTPSCPDSWGPIGDSWTTGRCTSTMDQAWYSAGMGERASTPSVCMAPVPRCSRPSRSVKPWPTASSPTWTGILPWLSRA